MSIEDPIIHINKHKDLHNSLDVLIAEFMQGTQYDRPISEVTILELLEWSYRQMVDYQNNESR